MASVMLQEMCWVKELMKRRRDMLDERTEASWKFWLQPLYISPSIQSTLKQSERNEVVDDDE
jgi:hypothetical protein